MDSSRLFGVDSVAVPAHMGVSVVDGRLARKVDDRFRLTGAAERPAIPRLPDAFGVVG